MQLGFETVGNATVIVYDGGPLLVTDPWLGGPAFFGSWGLSHEIPTEQAEAAVTAPFVWFSHGHPDHLNGPWLESCRGRQVLVPDHVGGRIKDDLTRAGLNVRVLANMKWTPLSENVRVWCFADVNQDAILLIDVKGHLIVNLNDAIQTGWGPPVRREVRRFAQSYLLQLSGWGDATMINFTDESGVRLPPLPQLRRERGYRVGNALSQTADGFGVTNVVPFSSTHRYEREDSVWANQFAVKDSDYADGFTSRRAQLLPPFVRVNFTSGDVTPLDPTARPPVSVSATEFGDDWSEELDESEKKALRAYFRKVEKFNDGLSFVRFVVGGRETTIEFDNRDHDRGVTFKTPRGSLLTALRYEIFDDLLAANFMETTLHGKWPPGGLGTHFGPYLTRIGDNGRAHSRAEVDDYLRTYATRVNAMDRLRNSLEGGGARFVRRAFEVDSAPYRLARRAYWGVKALHR